MVRGDDYYNERTGEVHLWKILGLVVGVLVVISIVFGVLGFFGSWANEGKRVISPDNVKEQHAAIIEDWEASITAARNACSVGDPKKEEGDPVLVESPALAYAATYRQNVVDYNSRQKNLFKAKLVGPPGYPKQFPQLDEGPKTDWCDVASELEVLR